MHDTSKKNRHKLAPFCAPLVAQIEKRVSIRVLVWAFPLVFFLHDFEEILTMERFVKRHEKRLPGPLSRIAMITTPQMIGAVALEFILITLAAYLATSKRQSWGLFHGALALFFLHVFTHIAQVVAFRGYSPGVVTAILLVLPYSWYVSRRLRREGFMSAEAWKDAQMISGVLALPGLVGVRQLAKEFIPNE
ncbi:uncharacterized protein with HXXEE motif [Thermosporothrix hazakensis]|jgi:hypothetical protein|uniref:Uncharacterized protein with HXXEE motif n=2 Tax=Thermosporothrix TaxID=768650 RepID=A0A326U7B3_THEHA|nr:HXXEE domain-containing protein [Thermosporothrix hazakensis]PZW29422.1 uncharacterized protein with HXXEE motif [Thermosporothrix hazakensis]BBH85708.1 hypothetical protein KTC_04590 [Thermosporothrix sp. COM3]GCE45863.1 hypothetical protein KTH_07320 [Thermosporothrix hazakensis]